MRKLFVGVSRPVWLRTYRGLSIPVTPASAATCDDFSNQADAQRAMTRDADGDGIDCEELPYTTT